MSETISDINQLILSELRATRGELNELRDEVNNLRAEVVHLKVQDAENNKSEHKFWAENWGPLKGDLTDIKNRLTAIEATNLKLVEKRVETLETKASKLEDAELAKLRSDANARKISVALGAGAGGLIAALVKLLGL